LKDHLVQRIKAHGTFSPAPNLEGIHYSSNESHQPECDSVLFKGDRMYNHRMIRFNYTTYDVRRSQDVVNPNTSHRDIMLLANPTEMEAQSGHQFLYARVLGIYHVNAVYTRKGMLNYSSQRLDFLWVRWFEHVRSTAVGQQNSALDSIRFPPMPSEAAFGFVDPSDVLRSCHIVPNFARGKVHVDGFGLSRCARDSDDWRNYYVGRYVNLC
jgi:hypothetical protein